MIWPPANGNALCYNASSDGRRNSRFPFDNAHLIPHFAAHLSQIIRARCKSGILIPSTADPISDSALDICCCYCCAAAFADWLALCTHLARFCILLFTFKGSYSSLTRVHHLQRSYIRKSLLYKGNTWNRRTRSKICCSCQTVQFQAWSPPKVRNTCLAVDTLSMWGIPGQSLL